MSFIKFNRKEYFLLEEIIKKNFSAKYKDSFLGILWSVLKPLLVMILLTIIFSTLFHNLIKNYPVYFLSGKCIFDFFSFATVTSMNAIKQNGNILKKVAVPKVTFIIGSIVSEFINFLITLIILIAVIIITKADIFFVTAPLTILPIISVIMIITGIGLILSILNVYYTDVQHLWSILSLMLMYASAIFYPMDIIPEPFHKFMILNPLFWVIDQFRSLILYGTIPNPLYMLNLLLLSTIILVFGIIVFKKYEKRVTLKF